MASDLMLSPSAPALAGFFNPRSIVIVGATARSLWTNSTLSNLSRFQFGGEIFLVNPRGGRIGERVIYPSCRDLPAPAEMALLMVPAKAIDSTLDELAACGTRHAVILSAGFAEMGDAGAAHQRQLVEKANRLGIRLLGPNCLGFVNFTDKIPLWTVPVRRQRIDGAISILSQSGSVGDEIASFCHRMKVGIDILASTGNEADIDLSDLLGEVIERPNTKVVAIFAETIRKTEEFVRHARRARDLGKRLLILKNGASATASRIAQSHTGALVGDDAAFDAACERYGMTRVRSIEELVLSADLIARLPPPTADGVGLAAISGGMCGMAGDIGDAIGISFPPISDAAIAKLRTSMPDFSTPQNPMDVTGAALLDASLIAGAISVLATEDEVGVVGFVLDAPERAIEGDFRAQLIATVGAAAAASGKPAVLVSNSFSPPTDDGARITADAGVCYLGGGMAAGLQAVRNYLEAHREQGEIASRQGKVAPPLPAERPIDERGALNWLSSFGVPTIPAVLVRSAAEAEAAAHAHGGLSALKILSHDIPHKSDAGGVMLNVAASDAGTAFETIMSAVARKMPAARVDGVLVSPMRTGGVELIVGVVNDPSWGLTVTVGLGGIWVELLHDTVTRLAPIDENGALAMLASLRGQALLAGYRGAEAVDRHAVARAIVAIADAAAALGPELEAFEVNPLLATAEGVEALDALAQWRG